MLNLTVLIIIICALLALALILAGVLLLFARRHAKGAPASDAKRLKMRSALSFFAGALLLCAAAALLIFSDLNVYRENSKNPEIDPAGIVFSITAYDGKSESRPFLKSLGHAWLSVANGTDSPIFVRENEILPGEALTFSVWALSGHMGVVYNLEPNFIEDFGRYDGRKTVSVNVDSHALQVISDFIDENDRWTFTENCTYWSIRLWNEVVGEEYRVKTQTVLYTPERLTKSLDEFKNVTENAAFLNAGEIFIYESGERTELKLCP